MAGNVRIRPRVLEKVAGEASAAAIGVPRDEVKVDVSEWGSSLAVQISARWPIPDLHDSDGIRAAAPIIEQVREAQTCIADELTRLTGRQVRRVSFAVTGAVVKKRKRVR